MQSRPVRAVLRGTAAVFYMIAGSSHFLATMAYVKIIPPYIPHPVEIVYFTGLAEIAGGAGLLSRPFRKAAVFGLIALLVAVFPANIYMATDHIQVTATSVPSWLLWARLPLQALLILWLLSVKEDAANS